MDDSPIEPSCEKTDETPEVYGDDDAHTDLAEETPAAGDDSEVTGSGDLWESDELEQAYQRALDAIHSVEWEGTALEEETAEQVVAAPSEPPAAADEVPVEGEADSTASENSTSASSAADQQAADAEDVSQQKSSSDWDAGPRITPREIIEAILFVGGSPITTKRLGSLLGDGFQHAEIDQLIDEINQQYNAENRPYEIRFGEGGYRLALCSEYEGVRNKVFGLGPKEVKLTQDSLEILALIAYRQPISRKELNELSNRNCGGVLRQLLRRELIAIERDRADRSQVSYRTTGRFLQLFGLGSLDELPHAEELDLK